MEGVVAGYSTVAPVLSHRIKLGKKHNICEKRYLLADFNISGGPSSNGRVKCMHACINFHAQISTIIKIGSLDNAIEEFSLV